MSRRLVILATLLTLPYSPQAILACGTPPPPLDPPPCVTLNGNGTGIIVQLGRLFETHEVSMCAAGIGISQPLPPGTEFSIAQVGVGNFKTGEFKTAFTLQRNSAADSVWIGGTDVNGQQAFPGATWFGFSNVNVPPVTPPSLGQNELYAIRFVLTQPISPSLIGLDAQYGSGLGTATGLPDFHAPHVGHSAQFSRGFRIESTWVPEPISIAHALTFLVGLAGWAGIRRARVAKR